MSDRILLTKGIPFKGKKIIDFRTRKEIPNPTDAFYHNGQVVTESYLDDMFGQNNYEFVVENGNTYVQPKFIEGATTAPEFTVVVKKPDQLKERLAKQQEEKLKQYWETPTTFTGGEFNLNQPAVNNYISQRIAGMKSPAEIEAMIAAENERKKEILSYVPFIGDGIDLYDIGDNFYNGRYLAGGIGLAAMFLPDVLVKGGKRLYRGIKNSLKHTDEVVDEVADVADNIDMPFSPYNSDGIEVPFSSQNSGDFDQDTFERTGVVNSSNAPTSTPAPLSQGLIDDLDLNTPIPEDYSTVTPNDIDIDNFLYSNDQDIIPEDISNLTEAEENYLRRYYGYNVDINSLSPEDIQKPFKEMFQYKLGVTPNPSNAGRNRHQVLDVINIGDPYDFDPNYARETLGWSEKAIADHQRLLDILDQQKATDLPFEDFEYIINLAKSKGLPLASDLKDLSNRELYEALKANSYSSKAMMRSIRKKFQGIPHKHRIRLTDDELSQLTIEDIKDIYSRTGDSLHDAAGEHGTDFWDSRNPAINALTFSLSRRNKNVIKDLSKLSSAIDNAAMSGNILEPENSMFSIDSYPLYLKKLATQLRANDVIPINSAILPSSGRIILNNLGVQNKFDVSKELLDYVRQNLGNDINNDMAIQDLFDILNNRFIVTDQIDPVTGSQIYKFLDNGVEVGTIRRKTNQEIADNLNKFIDQTFSGLEDHPGYVEVIGDEFYYTPFPVMVRKQGGRLNKVNMFNTNHNYLNVDSLISIIENNKYY